MKILILIHVLLVDFVYFDFEPAKNQIETNISSFRFDSLFVYRQ